jgi:amino acid transporter
MSTRNRSAGNPGRAALLAVTFLIVVYTFAQIGLQAAVPAAQLQAHSDAPLVYIAVTLGHSVWWGRAAALALALSVIALQGVTIVLGARIIYGMASHRVLPPFLANISHRYATPVAASVLVGVLTIGITCVYLLATSVQNAFNLVVNLSGQLFAGFYILTGLATIVYYRRRVFSGVWDGLILGVLPFAAAAFLAWVLVEYLRTTEASQLWAMVGTLAVGVVLMYVARYGLKSPFFAIRRESWSPPGHQPGRHVA